MKVALVTPFPEGPGRVFGGVAGAAKYLADELVQLPGVAVHVVVPHGAPGRAPTAEVLANGLRLHRLPLLAPWRRLPGTVYDLAAGRRQLASFLERLAPDVTHFQGQSFLAAGCPGRSVLTIHGIAERDALWDRRRGAARRLKVALLGATERYGRRAATNVILISEAALSVLPEGRAQRVWRIPNPVAGSFFRVERRPVRGRILCCSRVAPLKNLVGMIEAFALLSRRVPDAELRVAGDGDADYLALCKQEARRRGVAGAVHFLGGLDIAELQQELSRAACFALSSFQENAPLSLAEAMAAGVPAVAAGVGGVPEMVAPGETGLLVEPRDASGLADAAAAVLGDEARAGKMGARARDLARERYLASTVARRTVDVYRQVAEDA